MYPPPTPMNPTPLLVMRLRGSQAAMGAQHGTVLRRRGGYEAANTFYPTMAARVLGLGVPHLARRTMEAVAGPVLFAKALVLHRHRQRHFPQYLARNEAMLAALGAPRRIAVALLTMDVLQNTVGLLGRAGAFPAHLGAFASIPACSSLAVWGRASADGALRHARNFDFPGATVWDRQPAVVFCTPEAGLRYGFVTSRGADLPGVTGFNEAGITLTAHTRFHRDVRYAAPAIADLGHEIVRRARTLSEAVDIVRSVGSASTWGLLVSSAAERSAVVIETTGKAVEATHPTRGADHLACTNGYLSAALRAGEVSSSVALAVDSEARFRRLHDRVAEAVEGLSADDLEALLGDYRSPDAVDRCDDVTRLSGDCIVSAMSVQSIVAEPESQCLRVSVGRAPTGFGPYVRVPWSWEGAVGEVDVELAPGPETGRNHRGEALGDAERDIARAYAEAGQAHLMGASPRVMRPRFEDLVRRAPRDPGFRTVAAAFAVVTDDLPAAREHLRVALSLEGGAFRRARLLLLQSRVLGVLGETAAAEALRAELGAMEGAETRAAREEAAQDAVRPVSRARLGRLVPDVFLMDAALAG